MIDQIMNYCNNHFVRSGESQLFSIATDGIVAPSALIEKYVVGQYVWVKGSFINDGVYKITAVGNAKLTLDATLQIEDTEEYIQLYGCAVPTDFLTLVDDVESWISKNAGNEGVASESLGNYSVSYGSASDGSTSNNWQSAFGGRMSMYRQIFEELTRFTSGRRWY